MAGPNEILIEYLGRVRTRIKSEQQTGGIRLTGFSASSLQIERARSVKSGRFVAGASLSSVAYLTTNFEGVGVGPGVFPPFGVNSKIFRWTRQRGLTTTDARGRLQTPQQTAFLVAKKIFGEGTRINRGRGGIPFEKIIKEELPETMTDIAQGAAFSILEDFNKAILL